MLSKLPLQSYDINFRGKERRSEIEVLFCGDGSLLNEAIFRVIASAKPFSVQRLPVQQLPLADLCAADLLVLDEKLVGDFPWCKLERCWGDAPPTLRRFLFGQEIELEQMKKIADFGIHGYWKYENSQKSFLAAVQSVANRKWYFHPECRRYLQLTESGVELRQEWLSTKRFKKITPRHVEIVFCLLNGCTRQKTAQMLGIAPETVRKHSVSIRRHFNVQRTVDLARVLAKRGLVDLNATHPSDFFVKELQLQGLFTLS